MLNIIRQSVMIVALTPVALTTVALITVALIPIQNQLQAGGRHCCCQTCRQPCGRCNCQAPKTALQPILQERDIVATEYRNETVLETVPATVVENVTVDEGSYQTVWVPRLTTKAVARTTYQTRTACRTVPYQVTRRVSECVTPSDPCLTGRYLPSTGTTIGFSTGPRYASTAFSPVYANGGSATAGSSIASVPDARYADSPVTPIVPRTASRPSRIDGGFSDNRSADRGPSMFVPAPSAAQVWRSTQNSVIR